MIFDPHQKGHYLTFVRYLASEGLQLADKVTCVLRYDIQTQPEFHHQLGSLSNCLKVAPIIRGDSYRQGQHLLEDFDQAIANFKPDHIWVPNGDLLARATARARLTRGWRFPKNVQGECGLIDIAFHRPPPRLRGHARKILSRLTVRSAPWHGFQLIDPTAYDWIRNRGAKWAKNVRLVPDPIDPFRPLTKADARSQLGMPVEGRYVGTVGASLSLPRKGADRLARAFVSAQLSGSDRLLLAGQLGDRLRKIIMTEFRSQLQCQRIILLDRYLSEVEFMHAIAAMDVVCTPYTGHLGSSGVVLRAAQMERPVLASHEGWLADMIPTFGLGKTVNVNESADLAAALVTSLDESQSFQVSPACRRLVQYSAAENFSQLWSRRLCDRLDRGAATEKTWNWVLEAVPKQTDRMRA